MTPAGVSRSWLLAAVCIAAAPPALAQGLFDGIKSTFSGGGGEEGTRLEALKSGTDPKKPCGGDGRTTLRNAQVEQGLGVVDDAQIDAYLNAVAGKLVAASPKPDCRVRVYVTPHDSAEAVALSDGGILIALGFLRNLKSEDEVAALLGHELSHILLDHHSSDSFVNTQDEFLKGMDAANTVGSMLAGVGGLSGISSGLQTATAVGTAVHGVSEGLIAPAWTSDQEDDADLLGADLVAAAGFNPRAMAAIMDIIEAQEALAAEVDAEREKLYKEKLQQAVVEAAQTTDTSNTWSIVGSIAKITTAAVQSASQGKREHRPAAERKKSVNDYVRKFHRDSRRRAFVTAPWESLLNDGQSGTTFDRYAASSEARRIAHTGGDLGEALSAARKGVDGDYARHAYPRLAYSEVRLKQGDKVNAAKNLQIALERSDAPWQIYRSYADLHLLNNDLSGATGTVAQADQAFEQPLGIAPYAIKVYHAAGDEEKVNMYLDRCADSGKRQHLDVCLTAAGKTRESYQLRRLTSGGAATAGDGPAASPKD